VVVDDKTRKLKAVIKDPQADHADRQVQRLQHPARRVLRRRLAQGTCYVIYQKGQAIFHAGDLATQLHVLVKGQVKLSLSCRNGNERTLELLEPGHSFGQAELFIPGNYVVSAFAVKPSEVLAIRRDALFRVMAQDARIARRVIEVLARRQLETEADLVAQNSWSPGQRLLGYLIELAGPLRQAQGETTVTLDTSKKLLASRFDMQPETLSRNLRDLSEAGLIVVDRKQVRLRNSEIERYLVARGDPTLSDRGSVRRACSRVPGASSDAGNDAWSRAGWVNGAGRQRALSQRMAKSWLMLEQGLLSRQSRTILKQSVNLFDSRLRELQIQATDPDNAAICAELTLLWSGYRCLIEASPSPGDADRLFGITEDVLEVADLLARGFARSEGTAKGQMVNLAGRGRMLTQRAAKLFMFSQLGIRVGKCHSRLDEANDEFLATLQQLKADTLAVPGLAPRLDSSVDVWKLFQSTMNLRSAGEFPLAARKVFRISEDLLNRMDAIIEICVGLPGDSPQTMSYPPSGSALIA
jgi:CRP-like cAMP-binding protein